MSSPLSWVFNENVPLYEFDVDRANALLDDAGWMLGDDGVRAKDGDRLEFTMMTISRTNEWALAIQPFLEAVGIRFDVEQVEFGTWISRQVPGEYQGTVGGWSNGILDPRADLQVHFRTPRPSDATGYDNEEVNELFAEAEVATSREEEKPIYDEIQLIVEGTPVYVYLGLKQVIVPGWPLIGSGGSWQHRDSALATRWTDTQGVPGAEHQEVLSGLSTDRPGRAPRLAGHGLSPGGTSWGSARTLVQRPGGALSRCANPSDRHSSTRPRAQSALRGGER
jgi:ABC-type transport system substrate-binding protein